MASTAKEDTGQSSSAASDGSRSQPPQAGLPEAADDSQCPICLAPMKRPAYVTYCMHKFCLRCILQWARARHSCPVCRQPMERLLHSVRGDSDYKECAMGPSARRQRRVATERGLQPVSAAMLRMMQAVRDHRHLAGRSRPMDTENAQTQEAAPGPSTALSQQGPAAPHEMTPLREGERPAGPAAPLEPQNGTE
ncbi:E3 ubiquitin-protein ligase Topors-like [Corvus moneduloides]|uniref:E3 ubiquitin-protein ligase Topors-like n=1 Tax=Corvus moneduloides TaxID=1196302 RepID=UPI00136329E3|nr:E3 ubiquitin-protein ligase Topors-like [Corvus moneduloides]